MATNFTSSSLQQGSRVYFIENNVPATDTIAKVQSNLIDTNADASAEQSNIYYLTTKGNKQYSSSQLYSSKSAAKTAVDAAFDALT